MTGEIYEPYERLVTIRYLGRKILVPENNLLLRCFQFAAPESVPYGDFCWNGDCHNCSLTLLRGGERMEALACQTPVSEGDEILDAGPELRRVLKALERTHA